MSPWFRGLFLLGSAALLARPASALTIVTSDAGAAAAFQSGATVEHFDDLSALAITNYDDGQTVPASNQFSSRDLASFTSPFFNSGGASFNNPVGNAGTRIGIFDPGGTIAGEVVSGNNVAGPLSTGTDNAFTNGFMEVIFPADVIRVGFWIPHGTNVQMFVKDSNNTNLSTGDVSVSGNGGQFIGIQRDTADIRGVTIGFGVFTIDDFTYSSSPVPEPASALLLALGGAALLGGWRRSR